MVDKQKLQDEMRLLKENSRPDVYATDKQLAAHDDILYITNQLMKLSKPTKR